MDAVVVHVTPDTLRARRNRALASVGLTEDELRARVLCRSLGEPTPDERDAWQEVDTVNFLLSGTG